MSLFGSDRSLWPSRRRARQPDETLADHDVVRGHQDGPLEPVRQLSYIAWPVISVHGRYGVSREPLGREGVLGASTGQEMLRQEGDVALARPQRGQHECHRSQAVVEILTEVPAPRG